MQCKKVKLRSCRLPRVFARGFSFVLGKLMEALAFSIVDLTFHGQWHIARVRCEPPCSTKFTCLRNHPSLATRKGPTVKVARARCHYCSSKLCLLFGPLLLTSPHPRWLRYTYNPAADALSSSAMNRLSQRRTLFYTHDAA